MKNTRKETKPRNVRKDVREKLLAEFLKRKKTNPQQGGYSYSTDRAAHSLSLVDGKYYYRSKLYDGTICWTIMPA